MAVTRTNAAKNLYSEQHRGNFSYDEDLQLNVVETVHPDPAGTAHREMTKNLSFVWDDTTTADCTYLGYATIGTATSAASWQIKKVNNTTKRIYWADGDAEFDNVWDNIASLSYS